MYDLLHIDPDVKRVIDSEDGKGDKDGRNALHIACSNSSGADISEIVRLLLDRYC